MLGKKGLAASLIAIMLLIFMFGITSLIALTMWNSFNTEIQDISDDTISPEVKEKIDGLTSFMLWGDKLFITIFIAMFLGYIISSVTLPPEKSIMLILYLIYLIFISIFAMILSNGWEYFSTNPNLIVAAQSLTFTDFFLKYLPIITFFTGIIGGLLFYAKNKDDIGVSKGGDPFDM